MCYDSCVPVLDVHDRYRDYASSNVNTQVGSIRWYLLNKHKQVLQLLWVELDGCGSDDGVDVVHDHAALIMLWTKRMMASSTHKTLRQWRWHEATHTDQWSIWHDQLDGHIKQYMTNLSDIIHLMAIHITHDPPNMTHLMDIQITWLTWPLECHDSLDGQITHDLPEWHDPLDGQITNNPHERHDPFDGKIIHHNTSWLIQWSWHPQMSHDSPAFSRSLWVLLLRVSCRGSLWCSSPCRSTAPGQCFLQHDRWEELAADVALMYEGKCRFLNRIAQSTLHFSSWPYRLLHTNIHHCL